MREKVVGILGGMGPEATLDFFGKIVKGTKVKTDQEHLRVLIDNNPKVPNRTLAIQGKGPSSLPELVKSARVLESAGADFIAIPCVTAHYYYAPLRQSVSIPILSIVEETVKAVRSGLKKVRRIGLLATTGTIQSGLFQSAFASSRMDLILPDPKAQDAFVMEAVFGKEGIKAIGPSKTSKHLLIKASRRLIRQGAQAILAGCTEIPLALKNGDLPVPVIDPVLILAQAALQTARGNLRGKRAPATSL